jgi:signal transduction histidine kinase
VSPAAPATTAPTQFVRESAGPAVYGDRLLRELGYVLVGLPLGVAYAALLLGGLVLGTLLAPLWVGLPLLLASSGALWACAGLERRLANSLLRARILPLPPLPTPSGGVAARVRLRLGNGSFWRAVALLALRLPVSVIAAAVMAGGLAATITLLVVGTRGIAGSEAGFVGPFAMGPGLGVVLCLLAAPVAVVTIAIANWMRRPMRALARALLVTNLQAGAPVRETLAESLGDRTLSIAYWLADREVFVDDQGRPVPLPAPGTHRAWTAVDYEGRRVAAIIHDASLEASPELVQAAAAAASLALDNERLKADLRARVEELRASRVRIVEASNTARRRLERDLHDGAQQQLVALAIDLRLLRGRVGSNPEATELIEEIEGKLGTAISELQELARGIHPGILTDRGLGAALESLAGRAPLPVSCELSLPDRPPASVEAVAYFVVAEALTNVLKYAQAEHATIRARYEQEDVVVEMQDDGVGGADELGGTGLQGLRDRVGALDGTLTVDSPAGSGTLVRARIPVRVGSDSRTA